MALPTTFAALTAATGAMLDGNFAALGALTLIPCTITGTNALTLTPLANTPNVTSYQNYMAFVGIAAANNTAVTTAGVGSLSSLAVFKDTGAGPLEVTGGEIVSNNVLILIYDSSLLGGGGGFHCIIAPGATVNPVVGSFSRLQGETTSTGPGSSLTAQWGWVELVAESFQFGGAVSAVKGVDNTVTFNGGMTGPGGMDTGAMPVSGQIAVYAIFGAGQPNGGWTTLGQAIPASTVAPVAYAGANMPTGYQYSALIFVGKTDGSAKMLPFSQRGREIYAGPSIVLNAAAATVNTWVSLSLAEYVPFSAVTVWGSMGGADSGPTQVGVAAGVGSDGSAALSQYVIGGASTAVMDGFTCAGQFTPIELIFPQTISWKAGNTTQVNIIQVNGYSF